MRKKRKKLKGNGPLTIVGRKKRKKNQALTSQVIR